MNAPNAAMRRESFCTLYIDLERRFGLEDLEQFPETIVSTEGAEVVLRSGDHWEPVIILDSAAYGTTRLHWPQRIHEHPVIEWSVRMFCIDRIQTIINVGAINRLIERAQRIDCAASDRERGLTESITRWIVNEIDAAKRDGDKGLEGIVRRYCDWGAESELPGFDVHAQFVLSQTPRIPASTNDYLVSTLDPELGPFTQSEMQKIDHCLRSDPAISPRQRALIEILKNWGLRPIQVALLREDDYRVEEGEPYLYVPSVKGTVRSRLRRHASNFRRRLITESCANSIESLLAANTNAFDQMQRQVVSERLHEAQSLPRPLFPASSLNAAFIRKYRSKRLAPFALHTTSRGIHREISTISRLMAIPNTRLANRIMTNDTTPMMELSATRFRRTLGTSMALNGRSRDEVADALDHVNTNSIGHYFKLNPELGQVVNEIFASSKVLETAAMHWAGKMSRHDIDRASKPVLNIRLSRLGSCSLGAVCPYHPAVSCYACARFQPDPNADHQASVADIETLASTLRSTSTGAVRSGLDDALEGARAVVVAQGLIKGA